MSIRIKIIGLLSVISLLLIAGFISYSSKALLQRFDDLEKEKTQTNIQRVSQAYDVELSNLGTKIVDWSSWDDSYQFMIDQNAEYARSNLQPLTLQNLKLHDMVYAVPGKRVVESRSFDLSLDKPVATSRELLYMATSSSVFARLVDGTAKIQGTIIVDKTPYFLVASPVLKSDGAGPANGILIFTKEVSHEVVAEMGNTVKLPLSMAIIDTPGAQTPDVVEELRRNETEQIEVLSEKTLEADYFQKDIFGNRALYFHMELPRDVHAKGVEAIRFIAVATSIEGVAILLFLIIILDNLVLKRIISVSRDVSNVGKEGTAVIKLTEDSTSDEISSLIKAVNKMLTSIDYGQYLLRDERFRLQQYIDAAGVMMLVLSTDLRVTLINQKACDVLGYSKEDLIGKNWVDIAIPPETAEEVRAAYSSLMGGTSASVEYHEHTVRTKDNRMRLIGWHNRILKNENGDIIASLSSGEDITERSKEQAALETKNRELESTKKAMLNILEDERTLEAQMKKERDQAQTVLATMNEGLFVVDLNYKVVRVNKRAEDIIGVNESQILGRKLSDITFLYKGNTALTEEERPLWKALNKGESSAFGLEDNHFLATAKGKIPIAISTAPLRTDGKIVGALVTFHDISRDKEVKETIEKQVTERTMDLMKEQARLTSSISSLSLGFIMTNTAGRVVLMNDIAKKLLRAADTEFRTEDNIASTFAGLLDIKAILTKCKETREAQQPAALQFQNRWLRLFIAPVITQDERKEVIGAVFVFEDITESKILERSKEEFFSIASHELRTPLTAIRGNTSMIMDYYGDKLPDGEMKEMIDDIHKSSIRLIDIVNDFLNVSRLEQGKIDFKKEEFDLKQLISESVAEFEGAALEKHVTVRFDDTESPPRATVYADRDRAKQILLNLIGNALKFTEKGEVLIRVEHDNQSVRCCVVDTGRGISQANQSLLFRKFQQAGDNLFTRDTTRGTGLGLYISRLLAEGMRGEIWLGKSEEGKGSEFCFRLPIVR